MCSRCVTIGQTYPEMDLITAQDPATVVPIPEDELERRIEALDTARFDLKPDAGALALIDLQTDRVYFVGSPMRALYAIQGIISDNPPTSVSRTWYDLTADHTAAPLGA